MMARLLLMALAFMVFASCEENKKVIVPFVPSGDRVILLEEFTGKGCTNCPKGSREIENLLTLFPDNLVAVSIHAGFFANPAFFSLGVYDLRAPQSQELFDLLGPNLGYPAGVINRTPVNGDMQISANQWASAISAELATPPAVELSLTKDFNPDTRELTVTVSGIAKQPVTGDIRLSIMLTESGIIDAQDDLEAGGIVPDYVHKHVLRTMMTPATGAPILSSLTTGQTFTQTLTITLDPAWNAANMEIIAFISNVQGSSFPVLQASSAHVTN
jgi:hypothetical protein